MFKKITILILFLFLSPVLVLAANYLDGSLLRAKGDIKVYFIKNNTKRWVSSLEVFNFHGFKWQNVKLVSKKQVAAIKEGEPIILISTSPSATPRPSPGATEGTAVPIPSVGMIPTEEKIVAPVGSTEVSPTPVKVNSDLPTPDYIRADWLISNTTSNYGRVGQRIVFKYSDKEKYKIENFNLYEKKPGNKYFHKIAAFEEILSTGCEDTDIDGEWMLTEAGQCGYWSIQRIVPPGGRNSVAYLPSLNYSVGEYVYYVAGADKDGFETKPSSETKLFFLDAVDILSPINDKQIKGVSPTFKWTVTGSWPAGSVADYFIMISDNENALNPLWTKQLKIPLGETGRQLDYDGVGLDPSGKYKVNIYGHYRSSDENPDYISISLNNPKFWITKPGWGSLLDSLFALFFFF